MSPTRRYPDHPRFKVLRETIERISRAVPDAKARHEVFSAVYGMMRAYDSYHIVDTKGLDPVFDSVLLGNETWITASEDDQP